jgi:hypothetical protein
MWVRFIFNLISIYTKFKGEIKMTNEQMVKLGALIVGGVIALILVTSHPIISILLVVAGLVFYAIDSGKINL